MSHSLVYTVRIHGNFSWVVILNELLSSQITSYTYFQTSITTPIVIVSSTYLDRKYLPSSLYLMYLLTQVVFTYWMPKISQKNGSLSMKNDKNSCSICFSRYSRNPILAPFPVQDKQNSMARQRHVSILVIYLSNF